jgi:hypothetical protein
VLRCRNIKNYDLIIINDFKSGTVIAVTDTEFSVWKPSFLEFFSVPPGKI